MDNEQAYDYLVPEKHRNLSVLLIIFIKIPAFEKWRWIFRVSMCGETDCLTWIIQIADISWVVSSIFSTLSIKFSVNTDWIFSVIECDFLDFSDKSSTKLEMNPVAVTCYCVTNHSTVNGLDNQLSYLLLILSAIWAGLMLGVLGSLVQPQPSGDGQHSWMF